MSPVRVVLVGMLLVTGARADERQLTPDEEIAKRHFEAGRERYDAQDYAGALREFEAAGHAHPLPAFDFNIARCYDRMERVEEAIAAYRRYVESTPPPSDAEEVRARIRVLEGRRAPAPSAPPLVAGAAARPSRPLYRRGWFWGVMGGVVVVAGVGVGVGLALGLPRYPSTFATVPGN